MTDIYDINKDESIISDDSEVDKFGKKIRSFKTLYESKMIENFTQNDLIEAWNSTWDLSLIVFCNKYRVGKKLFLSYINNRNTDRGCRNAIKKYLIELYNEEMKSKIKGKSLVFLDIERVTQTIFDYLKNLNCHIILIRKEFDMNISLDNLLNTFSSFVDIDHVKSLREDKYDKIKTLFLSTIITEHKYSSIVRYTADVMHFHQILPIITEFIFIGTGSYVLEIIDILERDTRKCSFL